MCNHGQINRQGRCKRKLCYEIAHILFFGGQTICYGSQSENPHSLVIVNNWLPALAYMDVIFHVCLFRGVWKTCSLWRENTLTGYFFVRCSNSGRWARKYGTTAELQLQTTKKKQGEKSNKIFLGYDFHCYKLCIVKILLQICIHCSVYYYVNATVAADFMRGKCHKI